MKRPPTDQQKKLVASVPPSGVKTASDSVKKVRPLMLKEVFKKPPSTEEILKESAEFGKRLENGDEKLLSPEQSLQFLSDLKQEVERVHRKFSP